MKTFIYIVNLDAGIILADTLYQLQLLIACLYIYYIFYLCIILFQENVRSKP